jgi:hypothetical protein
MSVYRYRDLLWDLTHEGAGRQGEIKLRVFSNEQEMYETEWGYKQTIPITLPQHWFEVSRTSRAHWTRSRAPRDVMMELGWLMWRSIPPEPKRSLLTATPDQPCRLKISSNSPAIDDLPWEWLNDGAGPPFALRPEIRLARSVPIRMAMPPKNIQLPLRVLLVITNPKDERLLDPEQEIEAVSPRLRTRPYALMILEEPTWDALNAVLRHEPPHIVHYIGHAGINRGEGNLILHKSDNMTHWISGPELSSALPPTVKLLSLGTCFTAPNYQILGLSRLAHTSAMYRLPTAVANRYPVEGKSVEMFWGGFYSSLADHGNVNEAFYQAQQAVAREPDSEADWGSFSLAIRDQSGEVFRLEKAGTRSAQKHAEEIQAQLASGLANDLAEQIFSLGSRAPGSIKRHFEQEAAAASELTANLTEWDQS